MVKCHMTYEEFWAISDEDGEIIQDGINRIYDIFKVNGTEKGK